MFKKHFYATRDVFFRILRIELAGSEFIHGKAELDAAGFIRAEENDKRAPV